MILMSAIQLTYLVCIIVIALFAVAFIGIAALFFNAKKLLYVNKMEDSRIQIDVDKRYSKLVKKQKKGEEVLIHTRERSRQAKDSLISGPVSSVSFISD